MRLPPNASNQALHLTGAKNSMNRSLNSRAVEQTTTERLAESDSISEVQCWLRTIATRVAAISSAIPSIWHVDRLGSALAGRHVSQRRGRLFNDIEQVLQDSHIDPASFRWARLFDISAEHDRGDPPDLCELWMKLVAVEPVVQGSHLSRPPSLVSSVLRPTESRLSKSPCRRHHQTAPANDP
jgi:hypothetical protein